MTRLILIRHGQTDWNFKKRYCGLTDIGLNLTGKRQAIRLCRRLKKEHIYKVYASDRTRAIQFAELIFTGRKIEKMGNLREMCFGVFEGLAYKQIMKKYPRIYKRWLCSPYSVTIPQGESLRDFHERISKALNRLIALNKNKTIAVVCHGGVISVFINKTLKLRDFWRYIPDSGSMSVIEYKNGKPKIRLFNDVLHLKGN